MDAKVEALIRKHLGEDAISPRQAIKKAQTIKRIVPKPPAAVSAPRTSRPARETLAKIVEPPQPQEKVNGFPIDLDVFKQAIKAVAYAISNPDRPALNAVLIEGCDGGLSATAIDGHVIAHAEFECSSPLKVKTPIPAQYFNDIEQLRAPAQIISYVESRWGDVKFSIKDANGVVIFIEYQVTSAPEWRHLVPHDNFDEVSFSIQANRLASLIKVCKLDSGEINVPIAFTFNPDGRLDIERGHWHANPDQARQILATLPYNQSQYNKNNTVHVGIEKKLLLRTLKHYGKENVVLKFADPLSPLLLELESDPSSRFDVIMPMRLSM
jgi:DNA polymerase III sliding clamp (beta) subunit (PCNA family)